MTGPAGQVAHVHERALAPGLELAPCSLCGGTQTETLYAGCWDRLLGTPGRFDVVRCTDCGLARTNPRPTREAIGRHYPDSYAFFAGFGGEHGETYGKLRDAVRLPYRARYGTESPVLAPEGGARLLDVGSATGDYLADMARTSATGSSRCAPRSWFAWP